MKRADKILLFDILVVVGSNIAFGSPTPPTDCPAILAAANLNQSDLMLGAGHGIHSITVRDIRYYFDKDFPEQNNIPTVNPDFRGDLIKDYAPLGGDFFTPGMRVMDEIFGNDDGTDNYLFQGLTRSEKLTHGMHMLEVWYIAGLIYKNIQAQPPSSEVCKCVTDDNGTRLIEHLKFMSNVMRNFGNQTAVKEFYKGFYGDESDDTRLVDRRCNAWNGWEKWQGWCSGGHFSYARKTIMSWATHSLPWASSKDRALDALNVRSENETNGNNDPSHADFSHNGYGLPPLSDPTAWPKWLDMLEESMINESQTTHLALYIYCKKQALTQDEDI